tara:strand:+ start:470 stop:763 length:294 start_codon:yes stop_codon:yes gene_type:complete
MSKLYEVYATEHWNDSDTNYRSEVVASCRHKAQIIATEKLHYHFSIWGSLDFDIIEFDEAKDEPKFKMISITDKYGRMCWGCDLVTAWGESNQCECV